MQLRNDFVLILFTLFFALADGAQGDAANERGLYNEIAGRGQFTSLSATALRARGNCCSRPGLHHGTGSSPPSTKSSLSPATTWGYSSGNPHGSPQMKSYHSTPAHKTSTLHSPPSTLHAPSKSGPARLESHAFTKTTLGKGNSPSSKSTSYYSFSPSSDSSASSLSKRNVVDHQSGLAARMTSADDLNTRRTSLTLEHPRDATSSNQSRNEPPSPNLFLAVARRAPSALNNATGQQMKKRGGCCGKPQNAGAIGSGRYASSTSTGISFQGETPKPTPPLSSYRGSSQNSPQAQTPSPKAYHSDGTSNRQSTFLRTHSNRRDLGGEEVRGLQARGGCLSGPCNRGDQSPSSYDSWSHSSLQTPSSRESPMSTSVRSGPLQQSSGSNSHSSPKESYNQEQSTTSKRLTAPQTTSQSAVKRLRDVDSSNKSRRGIGTTMKSCFGGGCSRPPKTPESSSHSDWAPVKHVFRKTSLSTTTSEGSVSNHSSPRVSLPSSPVSPASQASSHGSSGWHNVGKAFSPGSSSSSISSSGRAALLRTHSLPRGMPRDEAGGW
ncbi:unnamed protein product [Sympodiomycopsis kandeliae]